MTDPRYFQPHWNEVQADGCQRNLSEGNLISVADEQSGVIAYANSQESADQITLALNKHAGELRFTMIPFNEDGVIVQVIADGDYRVINTIDDVAPGGAAELGTQQLTDLGSAFGWVYTDAQELSGFGGQVDFVEQYLDRALHHHAEAIGHGNGDTLASDVVRSLLGMVDPFNLSVIDEVGDVLLEFGEDEADARIDDFAAKRGWHPASLTGALDFLNECCVSDAVHIVREPGRLRVIDAEQAIEAGL